MNERIRELCIKSGAFEYYEINEGIFGDEVPMQRFAELIVRECIKLAVPEDSYRDEWFKAKCDVMDRIKKHFGVEE